MPRPYFFTAMFLLAVLLLSLAVGSVFIPIKELLRVLSGVSQNETYRAIILQIRLPRTVFIALVGAALAGSGAAYQGLFRNPLADPYLIGVASGAGLGAVLAMSAQQGNSAPALLSIPLMSFLFSLLTVYLVYSFARVGGVAPTSNLILSGAAVSSFAVSLTSFLMLRSTGELRRALGWLLGGVTLVGWQFTLALLPYLLIGLSILLLNGYALNLLQFGDEQAAQLGLNIRRAKLIIITAASLVTAAAFTWGAGRGDDARAFRPRRRRRAWRAVRDRRASCSTSRCVRRCGVRPCGSSRTGVRGGCRRTRGNGR